MKLNDKFLQVEKELNASYFERREVVRGLMVALIAQQHVLLLGPPGTGKSALAEDLCSRVGGKYFNWLLARTSTPEELFGPISLKALENDSYRRVTSSKLPEATVAFLDEIWKCNSAVLNTLLPVLNERKFFNDGTPVKVPLQMAVGASNELPEDREELGALWDRFMLRYVVDYLKDPRSFEQLLQLDTKKPAQATQLTMQELTDAQAGAEKVTTTRIISHLVALRQAVGAMNIPVSDRRWRWTLGLIKAHAWLNGRTAAGDEDLEILASSLWTEPGQAAQVRQLIMQLANPLDNEALDLQDQALEIWQGAMQAEEDKSTQLGTEANAKLKKIARRLDELMTKAQEKGKDATRITEALNNVMSWNKEVINKCLGIPV
jgi:MoxR-like ATPase